MAGALMAAALLVAGCAQRKKAVLLVGQDGGMEPFVRPFARESDLPPPKGDPSPDPAAELVVPRGHVAPAISERSRLAPSRPEPRESPVERVEREPLRPSPSGMAAPGPAGPPPDESSPQGRPEARRPDILTPLPTGRPQRYASPAPLRRLRSLPGPNERPMDEVAPGDEDVAVDASASTGALPPPSTAALRDEVPDTAVAEPSEIGSYHVQVSSSPSFAPPLFDKVYPFMADIDLKTDLAAMKLKPGSYWIRYALVDLLGFEHPFTRPRRVVLRPR